MFKISRTSKCLTENQVLELLNLLPEEYHEINAEIFFYDNSEDFDSDYLKYGDKFCTQKDYEDITNKKNNLYGCFIPETNKIFVLRYNCPFISKKEVAFYLVHEVRHSYQKKYLSEQFQAAVECYSLPGDNTESYNGQWIEMDAVAYAEEFVKGKAKEIRRIVTKK